MGVPVVLHEMRPGRAHRRAQDRHARRAGVLQLVPLRRRAEQRGRPAARGDAALRLADHGGRRCPQAAGRRRARGRPRRLRRRGPGGARGGAADRDPARGGPAMLPDAVRRPETIIATGPLTSPALAASIRAADRRGRAGLLRCDRADRPSRHDRFRRPPGSSRATTSPGPAAPAPTTSTARSTGRSTRRSSRRCSRATSTASRTGRPRRPISRAACRSRSWPSAGPETLALRADEAGRPDRSAHRRAAPCGGAAAPGQRARHAVQHGGLPDQAHLWRAEARSFA